MKVNRIPFTLRDYESKKRKVVTRKGNSVRIICTDCKNSRPIEALVTNDDGTETSISYFTNGRNWADDTCDLDLYFEETIFENGDVLTFSDTGYIAIGIFKNLIGEEKGYKNHVILIGNNKLRYCNCCLWMFKTVRLATDEEKQELLDALKADGKRWNAEKKCLEDIKKECKLKPFDRVLIRDCDDDVWKPEIYKYYKDNYKYPYICIGSSSNQCIPYEGNEELLDTNKNPNNENNK